MEYPVNLKIEYPEKSNKSQDVALFRLVLIILNYSDSCFLFVPNAEALSIAVAFDDSYLKFKMDPNLPGLDWNVNITKYSSYRIVCLLAYYLRV